MSTVTLEDARRVAATAEKRADDIGQPMNGLGDSAAAGQAAHRVRNRGCIPGDNLTLRRHEPARLSRTRTRLVASA